MRLRGKDELTVFSEGEVTGLRMEALGLLYTSLIGAEAVRMYLYLYTSSLGHTMTGTHEDLCARLDLSITDVENALEELQKTRLLYAWAKTTASKVSYIYKVCLPMIPSEFLEDPLFGRVFSRKAGADTMRDLLRQYRGHQVSLKGYEALTAVYNSEEAREWNEEDEKVYKSVLSGNPAASDFVPENDFDYDAFFRNVTDLTVPMAVRTAENLNFIGETAVIYGINPLKMGEYTAKCLVKNNKGEYTRLDQDKLIYLCRRDSNLYTDTTKGASRYDLAPADFLRTKQNGVTELASADAQLLDDLVRKWKLPVPAVNVLVEYALETYGGSLKRSQVEKIASGWTRAGVKSAEDAFRQIASSASRPRTATRPAEPAKAEESGDDEAERLELLKKLKGEA